LMKHLDHGKTTIHDNIITQRKTKYLKYDIYPRDMSTPNISMICLAVVAESSTSFKATSSEQVAVKPSPATSKLVWGIGTSGCPELDLLIIACLQE
jgi:hypothetical protein